jgi:hypothetical protein
VLDQVGEDVAVQAVRCAGVEGSVCEARAEVQGIGRVEFEIGRDDDVELGVEAGVGLCVDRVCVRVDLDSRVQLPHLWSRCFGALQEVSRVRQHLDVVGEGDGANAGQHEVLRDLVCERLDGDEEDIGRADLLLRLDAPESNLSVVEGNLVCN